MTHYTLSKNEPANVNTLCRSKPAKKFAQCTHVLLILWCLLYMSVACASEPSGRPGPVRLTDEGRKWAAQTLKKLSLEEKVGQMLNVRYFTDFQNFSSDDYRAFREQLHKYHIGSVVLTVHVDGSLLLNNPPLEVAAVANQLQRDSELPLLIAADFERGPASRVSFVPDFPDAMAFGATGNAGYAERFGAITAEESRAMGIQWDLFPVADVNSNPENPIINTRSFGEDPVLVGDMVAAFIKGAREHGMMTTAKHFPGHGDTATDSHLGVALVSGDATHLNSMELPPFKKAIAAGADAVMVAHLAVPSLEPDHDRVATISSRIVTGVLKNQLGFKGLIVTDALDMRGLTSLYPPDQGNPSARAAIDAIKAGNDVILWPTDLDGAFRGIVEAVRKGEIPESQIDESVKKILEMKAAVGLDKSRLVDLQTVPQQISLPEDMRFAQQVADEAVTVVRDNRKVLPLQRLAAPAAGSISPGARSDSGLVLLILTDSVRGEWGRSFAAALKQRRPDAQVFFADQGDASPLSTSIVQAAANAQQVVIAAFVTPVAAKQVEVNGKLVNSVGLEPQVGELVRQILSRAVSKTVLVAMGNPYLAKDFPEVQTYLCAFSNASSSELAAVKVLFGEMPARGRLPVTLPGIASRGFSLFGESSGKNTEPRPPTGAIHTPAQ